MRSDRINAYYLRLSLEDGDVADGSMEESCSISSQRLCVKQFITAHSDLGTTFQEFIDDGYSGTNMERPSIQRLLKLVEQGLVKTIIVRDLSRFARNYLEAGHYLEFIFPAYGVRFISINDHYDSDDYGENPAGLDLAIRNLINEMYSKDISRKIKSAVDLKKRQGEFVYGTAPYGYKKGQAKNTIVVDDEAAIIVKRIFKLASEGKTVTEIALTLNKDHVPTPSQHLAQYRSAKYKVYTDWTWDSVKNILENRIYTGDTEAFKSHVVKIGSSRTKQIPRELREIIPGTHESIISRELYFLALQTIKSKCKKKGVSQHNPLTSRLICGCCGNTLSKGKAANKSWLCSKARYNDALECKRVRADEAQIKGILLRAIQQQCALTDTSLREQQALRKATKSEQAVVSDEIKSLRRKHSQLQNTKRELLEAVMEDRISRQDYTQKKQVLLADEEATASKLAVLQQRLQKLYATTEQTEQVQETAKEIHQYSQISELTPEVMKALVKRVIVYPDNSIRIEWNFSSNLIPFANTTN